MANLPEELLVEILSWLPVESLVRFRCVCKSWYALFQNPNFVSQHMNNYQSEDSAILLRHYTDRGAVFSFLSPAEVEIGGGDTVFRVDNLDLDVYSKLPDLNSHGRIHVMCGHLNGIVALYNHGEYNHLGEDIILCNPAIGEFRLLPESIFHSLLQNVSDDIDLEHSDSAEVDAMGFGYDPKTDDYKVVRIVCSWSDYDIPAYKAEVFSLRADSTWREISDVVIHATLLPAYESEQFFDGVYYWLAEDIITAEMVLVSFDMVDEVFGKVPFPHIVQKWFNTATSSTHLGLLNNESMALFVHLSHQFETCVDVWVMKEFGSKEPWIKQLTIGPLIGLKRMLVFWKNYEELLAEDVDGRLISYNLATLKHKNVRFHRGATKSWEAASYRRTLVSVNARKDIAA